MSGIMSKAAKKITASNSAFLMFVKRQYNTPIFVRCSAIMNESGLAEAIAYLMTFLREDLRETRAAELLTQYR